MTDSVRIVQYRHYELKQVLALYRSVGWGIYTGAPERLSRAFAASLDCYAAFHGEMLVGLVRLVGDGESVVLIQDILVRPEYRRRGIGRQLIARVLLQYRRVRQIHVMTDDLPDTVGFYKAVGFTPAVQLRFCALTRM